MISIKHSALFCCRYDSRGPPSLRDSYLPPSRDYALPSSSRYSPPMTRETYVPMATRDYPPMSDRYPTRHVTLKCIICIYKTLMFNL